MTPESEYYDGPSKKLRTNTHSYLEQTSAAARHLFSGLEEYEKMLHKTEPIFTVYPQSKEFKQRMIALQEFMGSDIARATLAGSILQIAYSGIEIFTQNTSIPECCNGIVNPNNRKAIPFCIGRLAPDSQVIESYSFGKSAKQIPIGLIIYAGRNQYCHWNDIIKKIENDNPRPCDPAVGNVFSNLLLAYYNHPFLDLAFDLGHPWISPIFAYTIVSSVLGWHKYDDYSRDMATLLNNT